MTKKADWCIYTAFDANYRDIARVSVPTMQAYATTIGADFKAFELNPDGRHPTWAKIRLARQLLNDYSHILWIDTDALFVRFDDDIRLHAAPGKFLWVVPHPTPLHPPRGYCGINGTHHFNAGVMVMVRSEWTTALLNDWWASPNYAHQSLWDQSALNEWLGIHSGERPWLDPSLAQPADAPIADRMQHVQSLDLNWNSVPGLLMGRHPVVHHYLAMNASIRYQMMHQDRLLHEAVKRQGLNGTQAVALAIEQHCAAIRGWIKQ